MRLIAQCLRHVAWGRQAYAAVRMVHATSIAHMDPPFPCVNQHKLRELRLRSSQDKRGEIAQEDRIVDGGPEPAYAKVVSGYKMYRHEHPFQLDYGSTLPRFDIAYETWGQLNEAKDNAILVHTGLSASSHAASTPENMAKGWWEDFVGPGRALDTNRFFIICTNVLGGCYGSTGPSSADPNDPERTPYATRFPILSVFDMVRAQFHLLDYLGIDTLYASVGSSMGGMQSIAAAHLYPQRVRRVVSISGCARSAPSGIALRYAQRSVLMADPNWNNGFYYGASPPHIGMKLARQVATVTYRSGPEWEQRFGRARRGIAPDTPPADRAPALCPDFLMETYLDHQGEQFCLKYDANSLIYISKAMDLFDMSDSALAELAEIRMNAHDNDGLLPIAPQDIWSERRMKRPHIWTIASPGSHTYMPSLARGLSRLKDTPALILGAQSDILFPVEQQRELAECLRVNGNTSVMYYEIDAPYGHDSFLIDVVTVGGALRGFL